MAGRNTRRRPVATPETAAPAGMRGGPAALPARPGTRRRSSCETKPKDSSRWSVVSSRFEDRCTNKANWAPAGPARWPMSPSLESSVRNKANVHGCATWRGHARDTEGSDVQNKADLLRVGRGPGDGARGVPLPSLQPVPGLLYKQTQFSQEKGRQQRAEHAKQSQCPARLGGRERHGRERTGRWGENVRNKPNSDRTE